MSKRRPFNYGTDTSGKKYWRSINELASSPEFNEALTREFPEGASELKDGVSRRSFIQLMGASLAMAGVASCRRPEEKILPYAKAPEQVIPGVPRHYASVLPFAGTAVGVLVESHDGRPTKIEGNPNHPGSLGGTNIWIQADILEMYDPDRSPHPVKGGADATWAEANGALAQLAGQLKTTGGKGLAILTEGHRSPTLAAQLQTLTAALPNAKVYRYEAWSRDNVREGSRIAFGAPHEPVLELKAAKIIVALDADLLQTEGSAIKQARQFADGRRVEKPEDPMNRLYVVESRFTVTGASSDHRLRVKSSEVPGYVFALAKELAAQGVDLGEVAAAVAGFDAKVYEAKRPWVKAVAKDLVENKGASVLAAGMNQPPAVHAVVAAINAALGNVGRTVKYVHAFDQNPDGAAGITPLVTAMKAGEVSTLVILGGNPAFNAPADLGFGEALAKVQTSIHLANHLDETGSACTWHLNRAHALEAWSDLVADDGTAAIVQPLIAPLYDGVTDAELVSALAGTPKKGYELVRDTWKAQFKGGDFEKAWRTALHDGMWPESAYANETVTANAAAIAAAVKSVPAKAEGTEVTFAPCSHAWDGRYANNGWLQEMPDPMSKVTWDNVALVSKATAEKLSVKDGDLLDIDVGGGKVRVPALVAPGQADDSIALSPGMGRRKTGRVGTGVGHDVFGARRSTGMGFAAGSVAKGGENFKLALTQEHYLMEGRPQIREGTLAEFKKKPDFAREMVELPVLESIFADHNYPSHKWGMVIDLNTCIGCNACMVACQSENNIPLVGKANVANSREMHWIRIDRYYEGEIEDPKATVQPVTCQQCENAPCESVCPVGATVHSPEGLNDMAYNRCIGTRYCANNCPFKVRRFNFLYYQENVPELKRMQFNPDVTVRGRGVMEKCTYCVQRINHAKITAHKEGRERLRDGEVTTACQQGCPTGAITFGDLADKESRVARLAEQERNYQMLAELNVRPRTSYLARIRNPNPALETA